MPDLEMWSGLVGVGMPVIVALVNQTKWSGLLKGVVAVVACLVAAGVTCFLNGDLTATNFLHSGMVVVGAAISTYHLFWKPTDIAPRLEALTSVKDKAAA